MIRMFKNNKAQNVAEYAILIALVVGAIIAMQKFAQRGLQARVKDATKYLVDETDFGELSGGETYTTGQYEPYYQESSYASNRTSGETHSVDDSQAQLASDSETIRGIGGYTASTYNDVGTTGSGMTIDE